MQDVVVPRYGVPDIKAIIEEDETRVESHACIDLVNSFVDLDMFVYSLKSPAAAMALFKHMGVDLDDNWGAANTNQKKMKALWEKLGMWKLDRVNDQDGSSK